VYTVNAKIKEKKKPDFDAGRISPVTNVILHIFFIGYILLCIVPIVLVFMVSVTDNTALIRYGYSLFPREFSFSAYEYIFRGSRAIVNAYFQSIRVTFFGTFISTAIMALFAWPLSRPSFKYRKFFTWMVLITMLFTGGLVPWFIMYQQVLGIGNTTPVLIIPMLMNAWFVLIMRTYYKSAVPEELMEAARIDGAGEIRAYFTIAVPLSTAVFATVALFQMMNYWNDWFLAMIFIRDPNLDTIQNFLRQMLANIQFIARHPAMLGGRINIAEMPSEAMRMAIAIIAVGPVIFAYPFFQRFFVKGMTIGAIKG
jgi:putative aldouronate transport system permease protein